MIDMFRNFFKFRKYYLIGTLFIMTSCGFYSGTYVATYTLQNAKINEDTREISIDFIN